MTMQDQAKAALADFREELRKVAEKDAQPKKSRQKDSERRKQLKRERYREKKRARRTHDDAERGSNHAIAHESHGLLEPVARFAPGFLCLGLLLLSGLLWRLPWSWDDPGTARWTAQKYRVGGRKKKVRFEGASDRKTQKRSPDPHVMEVPFLGGPNKLRSSGHMGHRCASSKFRVKPSLSKKAWPFFWIGTLRLRSMSISPSTTGGSSSAGGGISTPFAARMDTAERKSNMSWTLLSTAPPTKRRRQVRSRFVWRRLEVTTGHWGFRTLWQTCRECL